MSNYFIYGLGFLSQILFGSRMVIQWIYSERAKRVVSPSLFWETSLVASAMFLLYGLLRKDAVIILGQVLSYFIYIRNLQLSGSWRKMHLSLRWIFMLLPFVILGTMWWTQTISLTGLWNHNDFNHPIFLVGMVGQLLLNFRFFYQLHAAEKAKASVLPLGFWVISASASGMVIIYALFKRDPVLLTAQFFGGFIYVRNIMLHIGAERNGNHAS